LKEEDIITRIDGKPPTDTTMITAFTQPVGTVLHLTIRRGTITRTTSLVLKQIF
jgi:C-terminal processing protease CtpA/Prc